MKAFFSFYFDEDVFRAAQVRNMGVVTGEEPIKDHDWEQVKRGGDAAIKKWIATQMAKSEVVIVLVGANTYTRPWVDFEIRYAWDNYMPLMGIRIHGLADVRAGTSRPGINPFENVGLTTGGSLAAHVPLYSPVGSNSKEVYASIAANIASWAKSAPARRR